MELWIRSQEKTRLIKANNILVRNFDDGSYGIQINEDCFVGEYKSQERALEILNEIQKKINLINIGRDIGSVMVDFNNPGYIYEMPKE